MKFVIINNRKSFIKNFKFSGIIIPQFGDVKDAKRFETESDAKKEIGNFPNCKIVKDIFNL